MTTPDDAIPTQELATMLRLAGLELSDEQMAALEPIVRRAYIQAGALRELPLAQYEPAPLFAPVRDQREGQA